MFVTRSFFTVVVFSLVAAAAAGGCSEGGDASSRSGSAACAGSGRRASQFDRDVSFSEEVLPLLREGCAYGSCHGTPGRNGLYLGGDASAVRAALLENAEVASMPFVSPGKPERSWLMRKLDGDFCGVTCDGDCGERMPKAGDPLEPAALGTIATWIGKGAPDN
jgi:hypothetical protein